MGNKNKYKIEVCKAKDGGFYWRLMHRNGEEIARSSETYKRKGTMIKVLKNMIVDIQDAVFEEV